MGCEVPEFVCKRVWISEMTVVHCSVGGYNYLHVEKPACPRKSLAELSSDPDYVSEKQFSQISLMIILSELITK